MCWCWLLQRQALLLRAAALDGCDGVQQDLISGIGGRTSASVALAAESEAHAAALQQLLQQTSKADCLLQHLKNLLPLRAAAIPSDLALRLVPAGVMETAVADEFAAEEPQAEGAGTDEGEAPTAAQLHVLQLMERGSVVTSSPEAALAAWLESLNEFCCSTMETRKSVVFSTLRLAHFGCSTATVADAHLGTGETVQYLVMASIRSMGFSVALQFVVHGVVSVKHRRSRTAVGHVRSSKILCVFYADFCLSCQSWRRCCWAQHAMHLR